LKPQGLSSKERIKSKKDFEELYSIGKIIISSDQKIKAIFMINADQEYGVKIAAVVSKKSGKAVWRNRVKRQIKETYRLNKHELITACSEKKKNIKLILSAYSLNERKNKKIGLNEIIPGVLESLRKIKIAL